MGYYTPDPKYPLCTSFEPDDTDTEMYITYDVGVADLLARIKKKWPDATPDQIKISAEYIHTSAIGYDLYDASDYTTYLLITYSP